MKPEEQTKVIQDKSDKKSSINKNIYNKELDERMDEILEMSREINFII